MTEAKTTSGNGMTVRWAVGGLTWAVGVLLAVTLAMVNSSWSDLKEEGRKTKDKIEQVEKEYEGTKADIAAIKKSIESLEREQRLVLRALAKKLKVVLDDDKEEE